MGNASERLPRSKSGAKQRKKAKDKSFQPSNNLASGKLRTGGGPPSPTSNHDYSWEGGGPPPVLS